MSEGRVFSEKEAVQLVQLAAKLQEEAPNSNYRPGISWAELQRIAADAGIDPKYLQEALEKQASGGQHAKGGEVERIVEGEVDPDDFDVVYEALGQTPGAQNQQMITQVGRSIRGMKMIPWGVANISVASRKGRTRITLKPTLVQTFMLTAFTPFLLAFQALVFGTTFGLTMGAFWIYAFVPILLGLGIWLFMHGKRRHVHHLNLLADQLAQAVASVAKPHTVTAESPLQALEEQKDQDLNA